MARTKKPAAKVAAKKAKKKTRKPVVRDTAPAEEYATSILAGEMKSVFRSAFLNRG